MRHQQSLIVEFREKDKFLKLSYKEPNVEYVKNANHDIKDQYHRSF